MRAVLRLDGNPRGQQAGQRSLPQADLSKKEGLGNVEEAVISKWGETAAEEDDEEDSEEEE